MNHDELGRALDQMTAEARKAQVDSEAASACLAGYRTALHGQQAHLRRLLEQIDNVREQVLDIDRWHDDGGRP